jgi:hypothetical protein
VSRRLALSAFAVISFFSHALMLASCGDPVVDDAIEALGPEREPQDELHRAGQPCVLCHSASGPASSEFSLAGTVYMTREGNVPAAGAEVRIIAGGGLPIVRSTNAAGNFFVRRGSVALDFPVAVTIYKEGVGMKEMVPFIGREPSCASCHFQVADAGGYAPDGMPLRYPATLRSAGPIYLTEP